ncbi:glycosyltransferase family 4 protein [Georgenia sp. 10Sc9-8]|uniref:Glycosyltransferase family 4 protein n=1 Tax=Georgenia halotolerans TaxID=3028317 RepID=A0ABT5TYH1_9MICO|nr:glycosyltransferase family 4 protein [Georgenia halotolerans]
MSRTSPLASARSVLVLTVVHHPEDARIRHREIAALLDAGWHVTYAAPFSGYDLEVPGPVRTGQGDLRHRDVRRATGRRRLAALLHAHRILRTLGPRHDVMVIHDPELLLAAALLPGEQVVWDVHEDTAAAIQAKEWVPGPLRRAVAAAVHGAEQLAERRFPLLLAEYQYQDRFRRRHVVVPNAVSVPAAPAPPGTGRVVYLGTVTMERGAAEMVEVADALHTRTRGQVTLEVVGPAHGRAADLLADAARRGHLRWHGFVPSSRALAMLDGALAGLSLLQDLPNYRHSMPTKILEYMAHGVPVVTTPLPLAQTAVRGAGIVVPFADPDAAVEAILRLREDPDLAARLGAAGHGVASESYDWAQLSEGFVGTLAALATSPPKNR